MKEILSSNGGDIRGAQYPHLWFYNNDQTSTQYFTLNHSIRINYLLNFDKQDCYIS